MCEHKKDRLTDLPKPARVKTPILVLGAGRDNMIGPREIEATARAYNTKAEIIPDVAHNSMLDPGWQSAAERILVWLNGRGLKNPKWSFRKDDRVNPMITDPASTITKAASKQTYYTIRFLVNRERVNDAYQAYAYFRWVDDFLDSEAGSKYKRLAFLERQESLLEKCYRNQGPRVANLQETMLVKLIQHDHEENSGLQIYLRNMMQVMAFDTYRRGRLISQVELNEYTLRLATAVMEAIHYFIGHESSRPNDNTCYLAVSAAHIIHMLRDTFDDIQLGYYNIPREVLETSHIEPQDVHSEAYRAWVKSRVHLAHEYFLAGKDYIARIPSSRFRLACFAYIARFEWLLDTIVRENYRLRPRYDERKSLGTGLLMSRLILSSLFIT